MLEMIVNDEIKIERSKTLVEKVYDVIKKLITDGKLVPGERLIEKQLVKSLHVSRTPLREVIRLLEAEGLVVKYPDGKVYIYLASKIETSEMYDCRAALEGLAASLAANDKNNEYLTKLKACFESAKVAFEKNETNKVIEKNKEFHEIIIEASRNNLLKEMMKRISFLMNQQRSLALHLTERYCCFIEEHNQILEALLNGNSRLAQSHVYEHILRDKEAVINKLFH